ncbi:hypothetical protein Bcav_2523 [Beutenbergia cavernae DSM 12333]|uniref:DNA-binding phage zinc finger domain-containing protein n=1 Tax=Beutenbergia cavernae (strain ATCC BAA-8 / DSM 12333 / CCUG 43141 / JCM 11478 / NBRC 16432 / NCIMB 13614 / HKI 0122) TaxID=471853 RepID=C5BWV5_BEUC1|nr:hypothetical protein [Beutenbergia cavernae]ACQ80771.1 hypothetical protein Bcav_2523 [Beutenbergia cavernae DSM 12333]
MNTFARFIAYTDDPALHGVARVVREGIVRGRIDLDAGPRELRGTLLELGAPQRVLATVVAAAVEWRRAAFEELGPLSITCPTCGAPPTRECSQRWLAPKLHGPHVPRVKRWPIARDAQVRRDLAALPRSVRRSS